MADISQIRLNGQLYSVADSTARANVQSQAVQISGLAQAVNAKQDQLQFSEQDFNYNSETGEVSLSPTAGMTVDTALNELSVNPVQNRVIAAWTQTQELVNASKADETFKEPYVVDGVTYSTLSQLLEAITAGTFSGGGSHITFGTMLPSPLDYSEGSMFGLVEEITDTSGTTPVTTRWLTLYGCHLSPAMNVLQWFKGASGKIQNELAEQLTTLQSTVGDSTAGLVKDVDDLQTTVGDSTTGLVKDVDDLQTTVGDSTAGLVKDVNDLQSTVGDSATGLVKDVNDLQSTVGDSTAGLVKDVDELQTTVGDSTAGLVKDVNDLQSTVGDSTAGLEHRVLAATSTALLPSTVPIDTVVITTTASEHSSKGHILQKFSAGSYVDITPVAIQFDVNDTDRAPNNAIVTNRFAELASDIKTRLKQVTSMPTSRSDGDVVLYVGATTATYTKGMVYQFNSTDNEWTAISAADITVDAALDELSTNPVQNKVVTAALNKLDKAALSVFGLPTATVELENMVRFNVTDEKWYLCTADPDNVGSYIWKDLSPVIPDPDLSKYSKNLIIDKAENITAAQKEEYDTFDTTDNECGMVFGEVVEGDHNAVDGDSVYKAIAPALIIPQLHFVTDIQINNVELLRQEILNNLTNIPIGCSFVDIQNSTQSYRHMFVLVNKASSLYFTFICTSYYIDGFISCVYRNGTWT